jgi:hypothetical protein
MKVEKRGDKYFVILSNGEVEISKESFDLKAKAANDFTNDFTNNFMEYLEVGKEFLEGSNFSLGESIDMKIDSIIAIERYCRNAQKAWTDIINEQGFEAYQSAITVLTLQINNTKSDISNPLKIGNLKGFEFLLNRLKEIRKSFKMAEKRARLTMDKKIQNVNPTSEVEQTGENDFTLSTIEDWLFEFKGLMSEMDYKVLVSALIYYFENETFPVTQKVIQVNGKPNIKLFGWALNRIFESKGIGVKKELLIFAKENISLFSEVQFDETNIFKSNLYKYFTTRTE